MPLGREGGFERLAPNWITYTALTTTASYLLTSSSFTAADQDFSTPLVVNYRKSRPPLPARVWQAADMSSHSDGFINFTWHFDYMSAGMLIVFASNCGLPSVSDPQFNPHWFQSSIYSAPVTAFVRGVGITISPNEFLALQCYAHYPKTLTPAIGGFADVEWEFDHGSFAP